MKYLKTLLYVLIFSILLTLIPNNLYADTYTNCPDGYCITKYYVDMVVNKDNSFDITEDIDVYFTTNKHGIFRKLPIRNSVIRNDGTKTSNRAKITNISVSEQYTLSNDNGYKVIKIGDPDRTLTGEKHYQIKYRYDIGKDKSKGFDELYFNIIGTEWDTTIENVKFNITMPKDFDSSKMGFSAGKYGTVGTTEVNYKVTDNVIIGSYDGKLNEYEGITIRLELPDNYFEYTFKLDIVGLLTIIVPIVFAIIAFNVFKKNGVDDIVVNTVEFYPPDNFSSLDIGLYYNGTAGSKDVVSLLIYLANKGYIKITDRDEEGNLLKHGNFIITKVKDYDGNDSREEKFLKELFVKRKTITFWGKPKDDDNGEVTQVEKKDLTDRFYTTISSILKSTNNKENKNKIFEKTDIKTNILMIIFAVIPLALYLYYLYYIGTDMEILFAAGMFIIFVYYFLIMGISLLFLKFYDPNQFTNMMKGKKSIIGTIVVSIIGIIVFVGVYIIYLKDSIDIDIMTILGFIVTTLSISSIRACRLGLEKRTKYGNEILGKINGFKDFLETAEKDKLEALVKDDPKYFYNILPYTYVLGVSKKWVSKFETIAVEPPDWYDVHHGVYNVGMMSTFMDKTITSAATTLNSSPSDSGGSGGSGGGGFSGGGSGGGGGGSW